MPPAFRSELLLRLQREALSSMSRGDGLEAVLTHLCHLVEESVPQSITSIMRYDPEQGFLWVKAAPCVPPELQDELNGLEPGELAGSCGTAVYSGETQIVEDTSIDPRWQDMREFAERAGIRSCWSVPIFAGEEILGTFAISRPVLGGPTDEELAVLETATQLAGLAIDRDRAHAELLEQRSLLTSVIAATEDPIFAKDEELRYRLVNWAEAAGVRDDPQEMIGKTDVELYPDHWESHQAMDRAILKSGQGEHYERVYDNAKAGKRTFLVRKSPILDAEGKPTGIVGIARDITALKEAEKALRSTQKLESLGVLAGGIAHDFNNLLTGVLGNADLALRHLEPEGIAPAAVQEIARAAQRAADLTHQMLAYAGRGGFGREVVSLPGVVAEVAELLASSISKKADLSFEVADDLPLVEAAPTQLRQVVMNILTNASEALEGEIGTIGVVMDRCELDVREASSFAVDPGCYARLSVADSGVGMDTATLERMFDPFFTTKFDGRGLGLAAVQGIVKEHGGGLLVSSRRGAGTQIEIVLPESTRPAEPREPDAPLRAPSAQGGSVLVVDDELAVRELAQVALENAGFDVVICEDGERALEIVDQDRERFDILLLDLTTPRMTGPEVARGLAQRGVDMPLVLTSGYGEREACQGFVHTEVAAFLQKPFRAQTLVELITDVLAKARTPS